LSVIEAQLRLRSLVKEVRVHANLVQKHRARLRLRFLTQEVKVRTYQVQKRRMVLTLRFLVQKAKINIYRITLWHGVVSNATGVRDNVMVHWSSDYNHFNS
jgi:hypothetical protein